MTRFARAKGSKASNERLPEEATSWKEMKKQLELKQKEQEDNKKRKVFESIRQENYNKFVENEHFEKASKTVWSEFPVTMCKSNQNIADTKKAKVFMHKKVNEIIDECKAKKAKVKSNCPKNELQIPSKKVQNTFKEETISDDSGEDITLGIGSKKESMKHKKNTKYEIDEKAIAKEVHAILTDHISDLGSDSDDAPEEISTKQSVKQREVPTKSKKQKKQLPKKQLLTIPEVNKQTSVGADEEKSKSKKKDWSHLNEEEIQKIMDKKREQRQKRAMKMKEKKRALLAANPELQKAEKPMKGKLNSKEKNEKREESTGCKSEEPKKGKLTRKEKMEMQVEFKRRKPEPPKDTNVITVNGKKMELAMFSGFPILKEDAKRLILLKKQMISKGIPRSEVERTMKLERRRCEKAIVRMKKNLCFNCRKSGHNLSECPALENNQTSATGICFKCGSTEHTHFECKVVRGADDFKFASCFICKEQGHISRQCPENPRGLYPKGGACKLCGDVTHFKKDCPTLQKDGEDKNTVSVGLLDDSSALEGLGGDESCTVKRNGASDAKRIKKIKF